MDEVEKMMCCFDKYSENEIDIDTPGLDQVLNTDWVLWKQKPRPSNDWSDDYIKSVKCFYTVAGFWNVYNKTSFDEGERYVFMRKGIKPEWEDPSHTNGAYIKIDVKNLDHMNIFMNFVLGIIGETLTVDAYDTSNITGITFINEKNAKQLKIWISDKNKPICKSTILDDFMDMLGNQIKSFVLIPFDELYTRHQKKHLINEVSLDSVHSGNILCVPVHDKKTNIIKYDEYKNIQTQQLENIMKKADQPKSKKTRNERRKKYFYPKTSGKYQLC